MSESTCGVSIRFTVTVPDPWTFGMYAFSILFKVLSLYLALKYGDAGPRSRPWIIGVALAILFSAFDVSSGYRSLHSQIILCAFYLVFAVIVMNIYYRIHGVILSVLFGATSAAT